MYLSVIFFTLENCPFVSFSSSLSDFIGCGKTVVRSFCRHGKWHQNYEPAIWQKERKETFLQLKQKLASMFFSIQATYLNYAWSAFNCRHPFFYSLCGNNLTLHPLVAFLQRQSALVKLLSAELIKIKKGKRDTFYGVDYVILTIYYKLDDNVVRKAVEMVEWLFRSKITKKRYTRRKTNEKTRLT